jgi:hypothetical protein
MPGRTQAQRFRYDLHAREAARKVILALALAPEALPP